MAGCKDCNKYKTSWILCLLFFFVFEMFNTSVSFVYAIIEVVYFCYMHIDYTVYHKFYVIINISLIRDRNGVV